MKKVSLTEGSVVKGIIFFALPLFGSSLIQQLYSTVDLVFVGQFLGTEASAAVGASSLIITCLVGFFNGMAVGTSVFTAQYYGGREKEKLRRLIQTVLGIGIIGGALLMAAGIGGAAFFLRKMGTPEDIFGQAVLYLRIYMLSMISIVSYNLFSGVIRAMGDSKNPMIFQIIGGIINIIGDYVCIAVLKMGVEGTAIATFASQTVAALLAIIYLCRLKESYALRPLAMEFDKAEFSKILRVGVPAGVQSVVITLSNIIIQTQINTLGVTSIAAFTVYNRAELFIWLPILALGQAVVAFVGQNYGAKQMDRIRKGNMICMVGGAVVTTAVAFVLMYAAPFYLKMFTKDMDVLATVLRIMGITYPFYAMCTVIECVSNNFRGFGKATLPMVITVISYCGFRIAILFTVMHFNPSVDAVAISYPVSWGIALTLMLISFIIWRTKEKEGFQRYHNEA